jgi:plasmid stabilization system protein ParE
VSLEIVLKPKAVADLEETKAHYEELRSSLGLSFAIEVAVVFDRIGQFPELYARVWKHVRAAKLRKFPYVTYYQIVDEKIEIIAVLHAKRRGSTWRTRLT